MCDGCFNAQIESNVMGLEEAERRRLAFSEVQTANEQRIAEVTQTLSSPTAKLLVQYLGQEIAVNLPDVAEFVVAMLQSVNDDYFTVRIGTNQISHHPLPKILQMLESENGGGVWFFNRFFPLVVILEQHTKVPTTFTSIGISIPIS
jgi:hypothetical protein